VQQTIWKPGDPNQVFYQGSDGDWRVFPEADLPVGLLPAGYGPRKVFNKVKVEVTLARAPKNSATVYLRAFDPDHPHVPQAPAIVGGKAATFDPNDTIDNNQNRPDDNRRGGGGLEIGGTLFETAIEFVAEQTKTVDFVIYAPQPGNNFLVMSGPRLDILNNRIHFGTDGVTLVFETSSGMIRSVTDEYVTPILNVWRTLHVERDSWRAPGEDQGPFNGDAGCGGPNLDECDDPHPGDVGNAQTFLLNDLLNPANIVAVEDPDLDFTDNLTFAHNYPTPAGHLGIVLMRDIPNSFEPWSVQILGAYEGAALKDFDPNNEDVTLGQSVVEWTASLVYQETIRDYHRFWSTHNPPLPAANTPEVINARVVAHEVGHLLAGFHHVEGVRDEGIIDGTNNVRGDEWDNVLGVTRIPLGRSSPV
jgi:hypothetical protein